jgi:hypothetical protein
VYRGAGAPEQKSVPLCLQCEMLHQLSVLAVDCQKCVLIAQGKFASSYLHGGFCK